MTMFILHRNLQVCHGLKSCGLCLQDYPNLRTGAVKIAGWAAEHNKRKIARTREGCPADALEFDEL